MPEDKKYLQDIWNPRLASAEDGTHPPISPSKTVSNSAGLSEAQGNRERL